MNMTDSELHMERDEKHERNSEHRIRWITFWAQYIKENPVEEWGPQHNAFVTHQLEAAREFDLRAEHYRRGRHASDDSAEIDG